MTIDCLGRDNDVFGLKCEDESRTVQSDMVDADINRIVMRFGITGQLPVDLPFVSNVDLVDAPDTYQGAMDILIKARDSFMELPFHVRARFQNDPAAFMDFCSDPANLDEMRKLGLAVPAKEPVAVPDKEPDAVPAPVPAGSVT